jgi:hypothetical protein
MCTLKQLAAIAVFLFSACCCYGQGFFDRHELELDSAFTNNASSWEASTSFTLTGIAKEVSFGLFRSIELDKSRTEKISTKGLGLLWNNKQKTLHRQVQIKLLDNERDTINISMLVEIVKHTEGASILGDFLFGKMLRNINGSKTATEVARNCIAATVRRSDSSQSWQMMVNENRFNSYGQFCHGDDTIKIVYSHGFKGGNKGYANDRTGLLFVKEGELLAALQTSGKKYVWLRRDIDKGLQQALAGLITAMLTVK